MGRDRSWVVRITTVELRCGIALWNCAAVPEGFAVWLCCGM